VEGARINMVFASFLQGRGMSNGYGLEQWVRVRTMGRGNVIINNSLSITMYFNKCLYGLFSGQLKKLSILKADQNQIMNLTANIGR